MIAFILAFSIAAPIPPAPKLSVESLGGRTWETICFGSAGRIWLYADGSYFWKLRLRNCDPYSCKTSYCGRWWVDGDELVTVECSLNPFYRGIYNGMIRYKLVAHPGPVYVERPDGRDLKLHSPEAMDENR